MWKCAKSSRTPEHGRRTPVEPKAGRLAEIGTTSRPALASNALLDDLDPPTLRGQVSFRNRPAEHQTGSAYFSPGEETFHLRRNRTAGSSYSRPRLLVWFHRSKDSRRFRLPSSCGIS